MMTAPLPAILPAVIGYVRTAGTWLAAEFSRRDGPRFSNTDTSPIDTEIELFLRQHLTALLPARFIGEEEGVLAAEANGYCWVVDPHDGTRAFLEGRRGSAISVALLRRGSPVLGVVYAPTSPDRGPDMIAWAEGASLTRNGVPVTNDLSRRDLSATEVVFLNHGAGQRPVWSGMACAPARFTPLPSIAYRLARVAIGDGIATVTLRPVNAHDIAAGHALLMAGGGVLVAEDGVPVTYGVEGECRPFACFGGAPAAVMTLRSRKWRGSTEPRREPKVKLSWPRASEGQRFDRALGCMLGTVIGDSLGGQVRGQASADGVRDLADHSGRETLAGQLGDASELGLALARCLAGSGVYDPEDVAAAYGRWRAGVPPERGGVSGGGFLVRAASIGVWAGDPEEAARVAREDAAVSDVPPFGCAASAALAAAIAAALAGADRRGMLEAALSYADDPIAAVLRAAASGVRAGESEGSAGGVLVAVREAFFQLAAGVPVEAGLVAAVGAGGDADVNAAVVGALLGAADGRTSLPVRWVLAVLTCRPDPGLHPARPRPDEYWADDLLDLTEALLLSRAPS